MIKVTALRLQNIFFFSLPQCKMTLKAFLPKLCALFQDWQRTLFPGGTSAGPARERCKVKVWHFRNPSLQCPQAVATPGSRLASTHLARIRKWILCSFPAHLRPPGPCPQVRFQVGRAALTGGSPHALPQHRSPSADLLRDGDLLGR